MAKQKKVKDWSKEPTHIWAYMMRLGVPKTTIREIKLELMYWAITEGKSIKTGRIMTVLADVLWDIGWRKKRVTRFLHEFIDRASHAYDEEGKPWERYYKEVAEKTGWIFQDLDDGTVSMCEVTFEDDEWTITDDKETKT